MSLATARRSPLGSPQRALTVMTHERTIKRTHRAADRWLEDLSEQVRETLSEHDRSALHNMLLAALSRGGVERDPPPKVGDRVRWMETDEEVVVERIEAGKVWGPWCGGEGGGVLLDEVVVVPSKGRVEREVLGPHVPHDEIVIVPPSTPIQGVHPDELLPDGWEDLSSHHQPGLRPKWWGEGWIAAAQGVARGFVEVVVVLTDSGRMQAWICDKGIPGMASYVPVELAPWLSAQWAALRKDPHEL